MDQKDSFARATARTAHNAVAELGKDMAALWTRLGVIELKTEGIVRLGRCAICGEPCKARYCSQHVGLVDE